MSKHASQPVTDARGQSQDMQLGDAPYIYSPYPDRIMQVGQPETEGEENIVEMINDNWPEGIETLKKISEERYGGYSGSFIRSVLRNKYAPRTLKNNNKEPVTKQTEDKFEPKKDMAHELFKVGLKASFASISDEEAKEAFIAGIEEDNIL